MNRDPTRAEIDVSLGLERTKGNYRLLLQLFHMSPNDYKRFLNFLRKYQCQLTFQTFRVIRNDNPGQATADVVPRDPSVRLGSR